MDQQEQVRASVEAAWQIEPSLLLPVSNIHADFSTGFFRALQIAYDVSNAMMTCALNRQLLLQQPFLVDSTVWVPNSFQWVGVGLTTSSPTDANRNLFLYLFGPPLQDWSAEEQHQRDEYRNHLHVAYPSPDFFVHRVLGILCLSSHVLTTHYPNFYNLVTTFWFNS